MEDSQLLEYITQNSHDLDQIGSKIDSFEFPYRGWLNAFEMPTNRFIEVLEYTQDQLIVINPIGVDLLESGRSQFALEFDVKSKQQLTHLLNFLFASGAHTF